MTATLSDDEWQAIVATIPPGNDLALARLEIEECVGNYRGLTYSRAKLTQARKQAHRVAAIATAPAMELIRLSARRKAEGYDMLARSIKGKSDPARDWLYWRLMAIWTDSFGKMLTTTSGGPLVRFLSAVVGIAMGEEPSPDTMRTVIRRARRQKR